MADNFDQDGPEERASQGFGTLGSALGSYLAKKNLEANQGYHDARTAAHQAGEVVQNPGSMSDAMARLDTPEARSVSENNLGVAMGTVNPLETGSASLNMGELPRKMRAIEMGFDPTKTYYHGTPNSKWIASENAAFKTNPDGANRFLNGVYLADDAKSASRYAGEFRQGNNPAVVPVHTKGNFINIEEPGAFEGLYKTLGIEKSKPDVHMAARIKYTPEIGETELLAKSYAEAKGIPLEKAYEEVPKELAKGGIHGFDIPSYGIRNAFDPSQIRSKFAEFDPAHASSPLLHKAHGGFIQHLAGGGIVSHNSIPQPKLFDPKSGAPISLPHDQIAMAVASGKAAFLKGEKIPVVSPEGETGEVPAEEAQAHFQKGYSYEPIDSQAARAEKHEYGDGSLNEAKAFAAGAARGATLGLSDAAMTHSGLVKPETLEGLDKHNPVASPVGNIVGVLGASVVPGLGEAAAVDAAGAAGAREAAQAFRAGDLLNPVQAVSKLGGKVAGGVGGVMGAAPEGSGLARHILSKALPSAAGSAVEGAFYGAGNVISDHAMGDPDHLAENIMGSVGLGAVIGGTLGTAFGIAEGALGSRAAKAAADAAIPTGEEVAQAGAHAAESGAQPLSEAELAQKYGNGYVPPQDGSLEGSLDQMKMSEEQKQGVVDGLTKLKGNSKEIVDAASDINAPVIESQVSASKHVQDLDSMLMQSPTPVGVARQQLVQKGLDAAESAVDRSLGQETAMSQREVGEALQTSLAEKMEAENAPIKELYRQVEEHSPNIPISDKSTGSISRNILKIIEEEGLIKGTPEHSFVQNFAEGLSQVDNLQKLKNFRTALARNTTKETQFVSGLIREKLDNLEDRALKRVADEMKTPQAKAKINELIEANEQAKSKYRDFREKMGELGDALGKRKIYGPQDFLNFIQEMTPEKFAQKIFTKNNSKFLEYFAKEYPNEMSILTRFEKSRIRDAAMKDGHMVPSRVFREMDKLSPEVQKLVFNEGERKLLNSSRTYLEAFPANINPSGTSKAEAYRRFFSNPIAATVETAKDFAAQASIKRLVNTTGGVEADKVHTLLKIERLAQSTSAAIQSAAKAITSNARGSSLGVATSVNYLSKNRLDEERAERRQKSRREFYNERYAEISNAVSNPEGLTDQVAKSTAALSGHAPNIASAMSMKAVQAAQYLYDKAPKDPVGASSLMPHIRKYQPSDAEISKWERYVTAVDHPMSVMKDLKAGLLTREGVDAVKTVYPKLYSEMTSSLVDELSDLKENLPYQKRLQLATFFGNSMDASTAPDFVSYMQAIHAQNPDGKQGGQPQGISAAKAKNVQFAENQKPDSESLMTRA